MSAPTSSRGGQAAAEGVTRRTGPGATLRSLSIRFRSLFRRRMSVQVASSRSGSELVEDHQLHCLHRLEILWRDLGLGKGEIELGFDLEHQRDHIHRVQSDIYQPGFRVDIRDDRVLLEDDPDDGKDTVLDAGGKV